MLVNIPYMEHMGMGTYSKIMEDIMDKLWGQPLEIELYSYDWLVAYLPLWKMMDFVSWGDDIPNMMGKSFKIPWFQITNQKIME